MKTREVVSCVYLLVAVLLSIPGTLEVHTYFETHVRQRSGGIGIWPLLLGLVGVPLAIRAAVGLRKVENDARETLVLCAIIVCGMHAGYVVITFLVAYSQ